METALKIPLAEKLRPQTLDEVIGQEHLLGGNGILRQIVEKKEPVSLIFWGPAGTGKTTLSRIIAREMNADFIEISAVISGKKDIEKVIERARQNWNLQIRTVLFVDEIHRFNKSQQDAFLPHIESGLISLIGATTENPAFEIIAPLISRSRVLTLNPLSEFNIIEIISRAISKVSPKTQIDGDALQLLARISGGDARSALGHLEIILTFERKKISLQTVKKFAQDSSITYDKSGEEHYNTISAFIKSMRAGDVDATGFYLAKMLKAGEDPKYIARRMVVFASEDIGLAGNGALSLAISAFDAVERIGMPQAGYNLFHCAVALAKSKKSRETTGVMYQSYDLAENFPHARVPLHLRNSTSKITEELGYTEGYEWTAGFKHEKDYLPPEVRAYKNNSAHSKDLGHGVWTHQTEDLIQTSKT